MQPCFAYNQNTSFFTHSHEEVCPLGQRATQLALTPERRLTLVRICNSVTCKHQIMYFIFCHWSLHWGIQAFDCLLPIKENQRSEGLFHMYFEAQKSFNSGMALCTKNQCGLYLCLFLFLRGNRSCPHQCHWILKLNEQVCKSHQASGFVWTHRLFCCLPSPGICSTSFSLSLHPCTGDTRDTNWHRVSEVETAKGRRGSLKTEPAAAPIQEN